MSLKDQVPPVDHALRVSDEGELRTARLMPRDVTTATVLEWGIVKGHNPANAKALANVLKQRPVARGKQHTGPHVFVVLTHLGGGNASLWPENKLVTEAEYDAAVSAAYGITLR